ncbi:MAG: hypothetical protein WC656_11655 [Sulfurimonas sp.]
MQVSSLFTAKLSTNKEDKSVGNEYLKVINKSFPAVVCASNTKKNIL